MSWEVPCVFIVRSAQPTCVTDINQQALAAQFTAHDTVRLSNRKQSLNVCGVPGRLAARPRSAEQLVAKVSARGQQNGQKALLKLAAADPAHMGTDVQRRQHLA